MTDWDCLCPSVSRLVCEDEVSGLGVNQNFIVCQFWIQPELALFSRKTLQLVRLLVGHEYGGQCVTILENGVVFSASLDKSLRTWDSATGSEIDQANDHYDYIQSLCVSGKWVATGGQGDKKIMVYSVDGRGKLTRMYTCCGHTGWVRRLSILADQMVSGSLDMTVRIWDLSTGLQVRSLPVDSPVMSLTLVKEDLVMYGDKEGRVSFLNLERGTCTHLVPSHRLGQDRYRRSLKFHEGSIDALVFLSREKLVITGSDDKFVRLWRIENWEENVKFSEITEIDSIREHSEYINSIIVKDNMLYTSSGDINVVIHNYPLLGEENICDAQNTTICESYKTGDGTLEKEQMKSTVPVLDKNITNGFVSMDVNKCFEAMTEPCIEEIIEQTEENGADEHIICNEQEMDQSTHEEEELSSISEMSSNSSASQLKKGRRWVINKDEIELKGKIGKGRYGRAFQGLYKNKTVAVKVSNTISKKDYDRREEDIITEVGIFCRCKHPSLVRYYGVVANREDLNFWLVTEYVTGHSLAKLMNEPEVKSFYKIRRKDRLKLSSCLAYGIQYLHEKHLVQGDLTPSNVLVCKKGKNKQLKITDFGLLKYKKTVEDVTFVPKSYNKNYNCFQPPEIMMGGEQVWDWKADVWCLGALLLEFNLENYMWDNHCIQKAKSEYASNVSKKEPIRFGLKLRASSFEFLWAALNYQVTTRPDAKSMGDNLDLIMLQTNKGIREMDLCDDMLLWCSMQLPLLAAWQTFAQRLGVHSVIPIVRDIVDTKEKVTVILESWKIKYGKEATVVRLLSSIQALEMQSVVDEFYREFQIPRAVKAKDGAKKV